MTVPHLPHEMGLEMWSAVDRDGCFVKLPRSINFVPPEGYKKLIQWELSSWLLLVARASAWLSYSTWNICIHWFQSLSVQAPLPSSLLPWRLICNSVRLRILGNVHTLFCNATPVPWRRVQKAYSVGIVKLAAACCTCFSLVIIFRMKYLHPLVSKPFCAAPLPSSLLPWRLICNSVRLRILGNVHTLFCNATPVPWRRVQKAYSVGIAKLAAACCTCSSLVIIIHMKYLHPLVSKPFCAAPLPSSLLPWRLICNSGFDWGFWETSIPLFCNATPVPWRRVQKAFIFLVGIVKLAAACCTCFSLVTIFHMKYLHPLVSKPFCAAPLPSSLLPWRLICNSVRLRILGNVHTLFCNATPVPWRSIFICVLVGVLCFGLIRSISKTSFNPPKEFVDTGSRRCPQCSENFLM